MTERLKQIFVAPAPEPEWSDRRAVIDYLVAGERPFWGSLPFDETYVRDIARRVFDRTENIAAGMTNHWLLGGGEPVRDQFARVAVPTLVMHGTDDPMFPLGHGETLAAEIPGARFVPLPGVGHQMPPREVWDIVVPTITEQTSAGEKMRDAP